MKKSLLLVLLCLALLCGCTPTDQTEQKQYTATFLELFDTVTTVVGKAESEEAFQAAVQPIRDELERYHKLFDIYEEYDGIANLKTVNDHAGTAPVTVDPLVLDLLEDCKRYYTETNGIFNPAMGSVLSLWHDAREAGSNNPANAALPSTEALSSAAQHVDPAHIVINRTSSTVSFTDPALKLDVGAIAKGWSVERVCKNAPKGLLLSVGGNVYATGAKDDKGTPWAIGLQNPFGESNYLHVLNITGGSVVTSGSYHRAYTVDGKLYHHIIDPNTLYPGEKWVSVSVVCEDSGLADVLSTSLFLLDQASGQALLDRFGAKALWVDAAGNKYYSTGFETLIRN